MPTKLGIMNEALRILGQTMLTTPDAQITSAKLLNDAWLPALSSGYEVTNWSFSLVRIKLPRSVDVPAFGYDYYYDLPGDYMRHDYISATGNPDDRLTNFELEKGKIATSVEAVYMKYVSRDLLVVPGNWSQAFADYVSAQLAMRTAPKLNPSALQAASQLEQKYRVMAQSGDAVKNPPAKRQMGSFARAVTLGSRSHTEQG